MLKKILFFLSIFFCVNAVFSQRNTCDRAALDTAIPCSQTCVSLSLTIPNVKQSTTYEVTNGTYLPYPFVCPSDTLLTSINIDDKFSAAINMPFSFCFYGATYSQIVIGSNGIVTFDVSNANCPNAYVLRNANTPVPIPYAGGIQCGSASTTYYPRACIMGAYHDIYPNATNATTAGRRISYYFTGLAPNRKMVISYYHVPMFSCTSLICDEQIVLYESTGIIDVNLGNKPLCSAWNGGLAILGIQNWNRNQAVAAPGKNCTQWAASNETYRFIPSDGTIPLFKKIELFRGNTLVATGDTITSGPGELLATFPNTCFSTDTGFFKIVTTYASCADANTLITTETNVTVRHNGAIPVSAGFTPASCASGGNGIITVTNPIGTDYQYSINNGATYQPSPVFTVPGGTYSIIARNGVSGCIGSTAVTIPIVETIRFATNVSNATCYGTATGQVLVITQSGAAPFQYSADGGTTYQGSNLLQMAAGAHIIRVKDNNNCIKDTIVIITQPDSISIAPPLVKAAYCSGNADGQIIIKPAGGTPAYKYALNNSAYQVSDTLFANVGSFNIYVKDNNGCLDSITGISVPLNDTMRLQPLPDTSVCVGSGITISPNTNATTFNWSPNTFINDATSARPVVSPQDTITYYLRAGLGTLCSRTDTFVVKVLKLPIPDAGPDTTICFGTKAFFHATAIRGNGFRWSPAENLSSAVIPDPVATGITPITYVVEVSDPYGCNFKVYDSLHLTVRPKVRAFAGQDTTATLGTPVQLFGCCMDLYHWFPSSVFVSDTARNPIGNFPPGTTQVIMITTTPEGCEGRDTVLVKGYQGPTYYVPSAFSPGNRDGLNDIFRPIPVGITETYFFNVFNRFGQLVYTTKTFMEGWDGRWKGEPVPGGAYVWMVKGKGIDGKMVEKKGTVVLMR